MSTTFPTVRFARRLGASSTPPSVQLSAFVLFVYTICLVPVNVAELSVVRAVFGFVLLSFVPGYLVVEYLRDEFRPVDFLYAVGLSVSLSMLLGWAANFLYLQLEAGPEPFGQPTTPLLYVGVYSLLTTLTWYAGDGVSTQPVDLLIGDADFRPLTILAMIPVLGIAGALLINRIGRNEVTLLTILLVGLVPVVVYTFDSDKRYYAAAIAAISLTLILQNTVIMTYLGRGDGLIEYEIGKRVIANGYWIPGGGKAGMPRIGVLHPVYALVMDMNLLWEFKLVHPILFALVPLVTYKLTARYFSKDIAILSATLYIFLPRTYQLLGRNTRTGAAIFFAAFLLLVLLDDEIDQLHRSVLAVVFFWSVISSHYGVGPLVLFGLIFAYILNVASSFLLGNKWPSQLPSERIVLYVALTLVWYLYLTSGTLGFVASVIIGQTTGQVFLTSSSTATRSLAFGMPSLSYRVMLYGHLLVGVMSTLGMGFVYLRYLEDGIPYWERLRTWLRKKVYPGLSDRILKDSNYIHLAAGIYLSFPLSFGPQILSAGRTFGLVMMILAPFPIILLYSTRLPYVGAKPALAALFGLLIVTSGFIPAVVTHDVSPQPEIDGQRIVESGTRLEQFSYYRVSSQKNSIFTSNFILGHFPNDATIHKSKLGKFNQQLYEGQRRANVGFTQLEAPGEAAQKYIYLSETDTVTDTNTNGFRGFTYYTYDPLYPYDTASTIYTTGDDRIHYNDRT
ncbi:Predicted membrane protein [Halorientalis persicus]|uniref:Predicted membrane protein n=1 Tax=Halorientalis persicus TaxID=1367881 RepID=A0A1H8SXR7_9EURY|nr:DUF2206 domain-containing protein [Halorientalis persicus]SEO83779.1 Predicted membrane protein [Halorientalis persicus]